MHDAGLHSQASLAILEILAKLRRRAPHLASRTERWMRRISPDGDPAHHFTHPRMFPILQLPQWLAGTLSGVPDIDFHAALTVSSVCGYYYIRLVDNIMDGDTGLEISVLPAAGFFCAEFQSVYQRYFPAGHTFWQHFDKLWQESCESAARDAESRDIDWIGFQRVSSRKFCAAGIPLVATCFRYDRADLITPWSQFTDAFARWSQMLDDVLDWHTDFSQKRSTYFLSEGARRKQSLESLEEWAVRDGFAWGVKTLEKWMLELHSQVSALGNSDLESYLKQRAARFAQQAAGIQAGFASLAELASILELAPTGIAQD
jgi:hypothetical protein